MENEPAKTQPEELEVEPSTREISEALLGSVPEEDIHDLEGMALEDALGYAFTLLLENGIEDPEAFLREKGVLQ